MKELVTFIVPSLNRKTLPLALNSIISQQNSNWRAIVCFDKRPGSKIQKEYDFEFQPNSKISIIDFDSTINGSGAGPVRNYAVNKSETEWVAFLDDDDVVTSDYVERLFEESNDADAVVFRMIWGKDNFLPKEFITPHKFGLGNIGVGSAVRRHVFDKIQFTQGNGEDFRLIKDIKESGMCVKFSKYATYVVRPNGHGRGQPPVQRIRNEDIIMTKKRIESKIKTINSCF